MADNTSQTGTDTIATDDVTTLNGGASSGVKVQRIKVQYGDDGTARDVSAAFPLPVADVDTTATGSLSAVGSVTISTAGGVGSVGIQITGTFVGSVAFEASTDGTNFTAINAAAVVNGVTANTAASTGHWRLNAAGLAAVRVRATAVASGTAVITLIASAASSLVTPNESLPTGTNTIGSVKLAAGTALAGRITRSTDGLRTAVAINYNATTPPTADTLLTTLVMNKGATNSTSQTSIAVTSGTILRLTSVIVGVRATVATLPYGLLTLRVNWTGAAVLASPVVQQVAVSGTAAVIGNTGVTAVSIEDGFELSGTMQLGLSFSGNLATNVVSVSLLGYEYTA